MKTVSFGNMTDYDAEAQQLADRKKYAEALRAQGQQAVPNGQMVGNHFVATHPLQHLANALRQYSGQRELQDVRAAEQGLAQRKQEDLANAIRTLPSATTTTEQQLVGDRPGAGSFEPVTKTQQPTPDAFFNWMAQNAHLGPQISQLGQLGWNMANQAQMRDFQNKQLEAQTLERQAAREQRAQELIMRLEDSRLAREERAALQRELAQMQMDGRRELAQLTAGLAAANRPAPAPTLATVMRDGKPVVIDARTDKVIGEAPPKGSGDGPNGKSLPPNVITKIAETSNTYDEFSGLLDGFKDTYGGYKVRAAGDIANAWKRNVGGDDGQADWWQRYQMQQNEVRNRLFGSALTATEKAEFDKAMINPGMTPESIKTNLGRQLETMKKAEAKIYKAYLSGGFSRDQLNELTGGRHGQPDVSTAPPAPASDPDAPPPGAVRIKEPK